MTFTTAKSDLHAIRRAPLNPMFSKRSIAKFEPVIQEKAEFMCSQDKRRGVLDSCEPTVPVSFLCTIVNYVIKY